MTAQWFVKTRGTRRLHDYTWVGIHADPATAAAKLDGSWKDIRLESMLSDEEPGLVLLPTRSDGGSVIAYVTGLTPPGGQRDALGREIRISILGIGHGLDGVDAVLAVAVAALRNELAAGLAIDYGITESPGFRVDPAQWTTMVGGLVDTMYAAESLAGTRPRLDPRARVTRPDNQTERLTVADDLVRLQNQVGLTAQGTIWVLRTAALDREQIERLRPWCVLTNVAGSSSTRSGQRGSSVETVVSAALGAFKGIGLRNPFLRLALTVAAVIAVAAVAFWAGRYNPV